jgi:hypothetical protein
LHTAPGGSDYLTWYWLQIDELLTYRQVVRSQWQQADYRVIVHVVTDAQTSLRVGLQVFESKQQGPFHCLLTRHLPYSLYVSHNGLEGCFRYIELSVVTVHLIDPNPVGVTGEDAELLDGRGGGGTPKRIQHCTTMVLRPRSDQDVLGDFMIPLWHRTTAGRNVIFGHLRFWGFNTVPGISNPPLIAVRGLFDQYADPIAIETAFCQLAAFLNLHHNWTGTFTIADDYYNYLAGINHLLPDKWYPAGGFHHHVAFPHATAAGHVV